MIDSTIVRYGNRYIMVLKDETRFPPSKNLRIARSDKATGPWSDASEAFTPEGLWVEGPTVLKVGESYIVYYDAYAKHAYGAMRTTDFSKWEDISEKIRFPEGTRHGMVLCVSNSVLDRLLKRH